MARRLRTIFHCRYQTVFANLDTPEKAYWLGVLITDGYISDTRKDCEPQIGLQMTDVELLEKFKLFLGTSHPVLRIEPRSEKHLPMYRVVVNSRRMAQDLSRYGVVPRKSAVTYLPILEHTLMPHLLRGILDGDGTVSQRHDGGAIIGYCGSHRLVTELRMWLICRLGISDNRLHENGNISFIQWSQERDVKKLVKYLYDGAEIYLARKFALVERYL